MKNCLFSKLKRVVQNDNLDYAGSFMLHLYGNSNVYLGANYRMLISGDGYFCSSTDFNDNLGKEISNMPNAFVKTNGCDLIIVDNYLTQYITATQETPVSFSSLEQIKYRTRLKNLSVTSEYTTGDIGELVNLTDLDTIRLGHPQYGVGICGDLSSLANMSQLENLIIGYTSKVVGNISALANLTKLETINLYRTNLGGGNIYGDILSLQNLTNLSFVNMGYSNLSGTVESLVESWVGKGKTTTVILGFQISNVTFNGSTIPNDDTYINLTITFSNGGATVTSTFQGTILATYNQGSGWQYQV